MSDKTQRGIMSRQITSDSKYQFLSTIVEAMTPLDRVGHITDFNDLSHNSYVKANELHSSLFSSFDSGITSDDWIQAGLPGGEMEKANVFFQWYARLHVAGVYDHEGRAICADCLPEDRWRVALTLQGPEKDRFKVSVRGVGESFYCDECKMLYK